MNELIDKENIENHIINKKTTRSTGIFLHKDHFL